MLYITLLVGVLTSALCYQHLIHGVDARPFDTWPATRMHRLIAALAAPYLVAHLGISLVKYKAWDEVGPAYRKLADQWFDFVFWGEEGFL